MCYPNKRPASANEIAYLGHRFRHQKSYLLLLTGLLLLTLLLVFTVIGLIMYKDEQLLALPSLFIISGFLVYFTLTAWKSWCSLSFPDHPMVQRLSGYYTVLEYGFGQPKVKKAYIGNQECQFPPLRNWHKGLKNLQMIDAEVILFEQKNRFERLFIAPALVVSINHHYAINKEVDHGLLRLKTCWGLLVVPFILFMLSIVTLANCPRGIAQKIASYQYHLMPVVQFKDPLDLLASEQLVPGMRVEIGEADLIPHTPEVTHLPNAVGLTRYSQHQRQQLKLLLKKAHETKPDWKIFKQQWETLFAAEQVILHPDNRLMLGITFDYHFYSNASTARPLPSRSKIRGLLIRKGDENNRWAIDGYFENYTSPPSPIKLGLLAGAFLLCLWWLTLNVKQLWLNRNLTQIIEASYRTGQE